MVDVLFPVLKSRGEKNVYTKVYVVAYIGKEKEMRLPLGLFEPSFFFLWPFLFHFPFLLPSRFLAFFDLGFYIVPPSKCLLTGQRVGFFFFTNYNNSSRDRKRRKMKLQDDDDHRRRFGRIRLSVPTGSVLCESCWITLSTTQSKKAHAGRRQLVRSSLQQHKTLLFIL